MIGDVIKTFDRTWDNHYLGAINFKKPLTELQMEIVRAFANHCCIGRYVEVQSEIVNIDTSGSYHCSNDLHFEDPVIRFLDMVIANIGASSMEIFYQGSEENLDCGEYFYDKKTKKMMYRPAVLGKPMPVAVNYTKQTEVKNDTQRSL